MATWMPTQPGDVLILKTSRSFDTHAVGAVFKNGQQDFRGLVKVRLAAHLAEAFSMASALVVSGGRIFLCDIDTDEWSDISQGLNLDLNERKTA